MYVNQLVGGSKVAFTTNPDGLFYILFASHPKHLLAYEKAVNCPYECDPVKVDPMFILKKLETGLVFGICEVKFNPVNDHEDFYGCLTFIYTNLVEASLDTQITRLHRFV